MLADPVKLKSSSMYIGYVILREILKRDKKPITIYELYETLRAAGIGTSRQLILGLTFLYSVDVVDFENGMIMVKDRTEKVD